MTLPLNHLLKRVSARIEQKRYLSDLTPYHADIIRKIRSKKLTYLSETKLAALASSCHAMEQAKVQGAFIEAGCALGGSTILIASCKSIIRPLYVYDVFGMIPGPTSKDPARTHDRYSEIASGASAGIDGDTYYGYRTDLQDTVTANLHEFGISPDVMHVHLIKGLVQKTLHVDGPVALAHIDVDWHEPVDTCLRRVFPHLSVNGEIILDDYYDWGGCRTAADEFLKEVDGKFTLDDRSGAMKITKISE